MSTYLLDTNALSELVKNPDGEVARTHERAVRHPGNILAVSIITACEIRYGAERRCSKKLTERIDEILAAFLVLPLDVGADSTYAKVRADLEERGQLIGPNDMLIAAHALALDAILVTDDVSEFKRVKGLRVENWLRSKS